MNSFGVLTIAFGKERYIEQGNTLARSLRKHMPNVPIACVSDAELDPKLFDYTIPVDLRRGGSFIQKLWIDDYSPFDSTLFIDSDCIVGAPFSEHVDAMKKYAFTPVCDAYLVKGDVDKDGWISDIGEALAMVGGEKYAKFNGGVYYFDKSEQAKKLFQVVRHFAERGDELGLLAPTGAGFGDEAIFALALASLNMLPLYDDKGQLMRTPIGLRGKIKMDSDYSNFSFNKNGKLVSPAICHFAGSFESPEYMKATQFFKNGKVSLRDSVAIWWHHTKTMAKNYSYTIRRKLA